MTERIQKTERFLREKLSESLYFKEHPEAYAYRLEHSIRVARIAGEIAKAEGMDEEAMVIAGLLHDVSYCRTLDEDGWRNHGRDAASIARPFLESMGFSEQRVQEICFGIAIHVDGEAGFVGECTPFALTITDADNIDRFDVYRIYETLENIGFRKLSVSQKRSYVEQVLGRLEQFADVKFATAAASDLWRERIEFYQEFYRRLRSQIELSVWHLDVEEKSAAAPEVSENLIGLSGHF